MPDFEKMARDADELASSIDSPTERATYRAIAEMWRRMASDKAAPDASAPGRAVEKGGEAREG